MYQHQGKFLSDHPGFFLAIILILSLPAFSQLGMLLGGRGQLELGTRYDRYSASEVQQVSGELARIMPVRGRAGILPGRVSYLNLALGYRFEEGLDTLKIRWRAGLMKADFSRKQLLWGLSLVYYDKSGLLEENVDWVNLRLGGGFKVASKSVSITPHLQGNAGPGRMRLGSIHYPALGELADSTLRGLKAGYKAGAMLQIGRRLFLLADYSTLVMIDTPEPTFEQINVQAVLPLGQFSGNFFSVYVRFLKETVEINNSTRSEENTHVRAGLRLFLGRAQPKKPSWDDF